MKTQSPTHKTSTGHTRAHDMPSTLLSKIVRAAALGTEFRQMLEAIEVGIAMGCVTGLESARAAFFILDRIYPQEILKI